MFVEKLEEIDQRLEHLKCSKGMGNSTTGLPFPGKSSWRDKNECRGDEGNGRRSGGHVDKTGNARSYPKAGLVLEQCVRDSKKRWGFQTHNESEKN